MGKTATNISIVLGLLTVALAGYYIFTQQGADILDISSTNQTSQDVLNRTQAFMENGRVLDKIDLDISIFEDRRFTSLRSFTTPIERQPVGRSNPFIEADEVEDNN